MNVGLVILGVVLIGLIGFVLGRIRSIKLAEDHGTRLHSLPVYYGQAVSFFAVVPALALLFVWLAVQPWIIQSNVTDIFDADRSMDAATRSLTMADVRRIADGLELGLAQGVFDPADLPDMKTTENDIRGLLGQVGVALGSDVEQTVFDAAKSYRLATRAGLTWAGVLTLLVSLAGAIWTYSRIHPDYRARNISEGATYAVLMLSSSVAILTTIGIILSLVFEAVHFFRLYPARDFFFSLTWNPQFRGGSDLGIIPLLWGTLYVSFVALLVAVPIGLFAAVYLAEYASRRVRGFAKPMIEVLAGIPTIVYGLFALITVGPLLRDYFAEPLGLGTSSSSVMTAGLVMGIMLIPFVSSLSDDVINAVPQSMRDGSYGLGATKSETVRQVILPAALPGIVGSILLATSRAIGETMIVVMGAGAAAKLDLNPFEAMTTITVKIVSQLTGDTEFASPETLVAFALGLSLFVVTLGLNVIALIVVRKYREQYE
jgi:phosphate transport system permease protein